MKILEMSLILSACLIPNIYNRQIHVTEFDIMTDVDIYVAGCLDSNKLDPNSTKTKMRYC